MKKKISKVLFTVLIIAGIVFSVSNFLLVNLEAVPVPYATAYAYDINGETIYLCSGMPSDCVIEIPWPI